ncbi:MAG: aspartate kinase [Polyangia bacterium]
MPGIVVQKYGGSSVADPARLGRVADRVAETARAGHRVVVVVSAMGKTTDELYALARAVTPSPSRRELDMLLSCGERISMALLAMALEHRGLAAISFTGSQSGIITNDRHTGARIIEVRPVRIEDELERGRIVIVAGFQGMSDKREITTLGRGGSDTTAVALAAALGAQWCEICSDVDGVYSADPRVVPDAHRLDAISYAEMSELASHGARVLNAEAVAWAARAGIEILARATGTAPLGPSIDGRGDRPVGGTRVGRALGHAGPRAVTGTRVVTVVHDVDALTIAAEERLPLRSVHGSELRFVRDDIPDWPRIAARFTSVREVGEVTLVGPGIAADPELVRVAATGAIAVSASASAITIDVPTDRVDDMTRALHEALVVR